MQKYLDILKNSALFSGIDTKDLMPFDEHKNL